MAKLTPLEKNLFKILGVILLCVIGWYVDHVESVNKAQWNKMSGIEKRLNELHTE
jgi:hypothetical protein